MILFFAMLLTSRASDAATLGLAWDPPTDGVTAGYVVRYGTSPGNYSQSIDVGMVTGYSITTLADGTTYYFAVQAYNATHEFGPLSAEVSGTTPGGITPPAPPQNLAATLSGSTVNLAWQSPGGTVSGYRIEVGTASGQSNVTTINTGTGTTYALSGLAAGTYYIRVRAVNSAGTSAPSNEVVVTVPSSAPVPPTNLSATVRNNQYVDLTWTAATGSVTGYRVEVGTGSGLTNVTTVNLGAVTTYTVNGLTPGTYYIRVRTVNSGGTSGPSNEVTATLGTAPAPPTNLAANVRDGVAADFSWQAPSGTVSGYRVEVGTAAGQSNIRSVTVSVTNLTINDLRGGPYYVRVRTVNGTQVSAPSNEVTVLFAPAAPTSLTAAIRRRKDIDLSWQAPSTGAASYAVEVGTAVGRSDVGSTTTTTTRFTLPDMPAGTYYIRVRAMNSAGASAASNEVSATITRGGRPIPPSNLTATLSDGNLIEVTWQPEDDEALYYRVEVGTTPGRTDVSSFTTGVTSRFTIGELPAGRYYIRVRSANDHGFSDPTPEVVVAGAGGTDAPRRLSATVNGAGVLRLFWDPPQDASGVTGYVVEAGAGPGRADLATIPTSTASFTAGPVPNGTYFLRVRSVTAAGNGSASNEVVVHVGEAQQCTAAPAAPRLVANAVGNVLELSWAPGIGDAPTGYVLDVGSTPGGRDIVSAPLGADITTLTSHVPNGSYALRLTAVNACGASAWGSDTFVTVGGPEIPLPGAPGWLEQQVSGRSVTLTWTPPYTGGEATSYRIEVLAANDLVILSLQTGNASTTFTHGDVPPGQYRVRVRALNARGAGDPSNTVVVSVP